MIEKRQPITSIPTTPTVQTAYSQLVEEKAISASDLVEAILIQHEEYGNHSQPSSLGEYRSSHFKHVDEWLREVESLFEPSRNSELHGRLVIFGLALLEEGLYQFLDRDGFLTRLKNEIKEKPEELLSAFGLSRLSMVNGTSNQTPNHTDEPVKGKAEDLLGRAAYSVNLAKRIKSEANNQEPYALHIYGAWGAGKSSLLNFIKEELVGNESPPTKTTFRKALGLCIKNSVFLARWLHSRLVTRNKLAEPEKTEEGWVVVEFNAWQNQHINPPWWALLDAVFLKVKSQLSWPHYFKESYWRLTMGSTYKPLLVTLAIIFLLWIWLGDTVNTIEDNTDKTLKVVDYVQRILGSVGALWIAFQSVSQSFFFRSSRAASTYVETTSDPMQQLANHFKTLIENVHKSSNKRVAIFIDDLDRCQEKYVVSLLEGFQIIFRHAPVVLVVAADRNWLNASFNHVYRSLEQQIQEPGKSLGSLFLEKVFQATAPIPQIPPPLLKLYWQSLLKKGDESQTLKQFESLVAEELKFMATKNTEEEIVSETHSGQTGSALQHQARIQAAVIRLGDEKIVSHYEKHTLADLALLLRPNPRAMKRLVNAYGINRALTVLSDLQIDSKQLGLWTIFELQWPLLTEHLRKHPEDINYLLEGSDLEELLTMTDPKLQGLFTDAAVKRVANSEPKLNVDVVKKCSALQS